MNIDFLEEQARKCINEMDKETVIDLLFAVAGQSPDQVEKVMTDSRTKGMFPFVMWMLLTGAKRDGVTEGIEKSGGDPSILHGGLEEIS